MPDNPKNMLLENLALLKRLGKYAVQQCFRNTVLEEFHRGTVPVSQKGDFFRCRREDLLSRDLVVGLLRLTDEERKLAIRDAVNKTYRFPCRLFDVGGDLILRLDEQPLTLADAAAVEVALDPIRASILDALTEPGSATTVAAAVGLTRQKVNYHLKALEAHGLVESVEERAWGGLTERFVRRSARRLVVAPDVLQSAAIDPHEVADRLSAAYLIAVNARTVSEVGAIASTAAATGTRLPTLTVDTVIGFRSPEDRAAFATDLQSALAALAVRYHHDDGRPHRLTVSSYPRPKEEPS